MRKTILLVIVSLLLASLAWGQGTITHQSPQSYWQQKGMSTITGLPKGDGAGNYTAAGAGVDYLAPNGSGLSLTGVTKIIYQTGLPLVIPSSGTIGDNGALSGITALPQTYSSGCYMYFPANAIAAGSAAGLYYTVMSTTQVGTIYNNTYTSGVPTIPANPTAFVTVGPGAYVQTTGAAITLQSYMLPANNLGINGRLRFTSIWSIPNNGNNKTLSLTWGGSNFATSVFTASAIVVFARNIWARGVTNLQASENAGATGSGASTGAVAIYTKDTTQAQAITATANLAVATDYAISGLLSIELIN